MTTPIHIRAQPDDVAPIVLLPGDPGRATRVAERLDGARCYNEFRGLLGYTGSYRGTPVSVQTTGMGAPSAAIVVEELAMLGVQTVIRIGTCGGAQPEIRPADLIVATGAYPLDGTTRQYLGDDPDTPEATDRVVRALVEAAERMGARHHVGLVATEDALYAVTADWAETWAARGVLAQEMEASAVFTVAALRGLEAGCLLTASNSAGEHERLPDDELLPAIDRMIEVALEAAVALSGEGSSPA
ncbi:MAG: purine-nucleoside phosphorylase [Chloroflexi bacterium]|nr:purine-nucleoside phosphorylase [Chloroflexota bacterium]